MTAPLIFSLFDSDSLADSLSLAVQGKIGDLQTRRFPDQECYLRYLTSPKDRFVIIVSFLDHPDDKLLSLLFAAAAARNLGAISVGLVCPYLPYMRQDKQFKDGEAVTAPLFADILSPAFDWLVTIDPHLHRLGALSDIYTIPTTVLHAAPLMAEWIRQSVERPLIIGPDMESKQWVSDVAEQISAPYVVLEKTRYGDHNVEITLPDISQWISHTPVILDDIVSTAHTMIETVQHLKGLNQKAPICVAVHGIFSDRAYQKLLASGVAKIITCNTVPHVSNMIDITGLLAMGVKRCLHPASRHC